MNYGPEDDIIRICEGLQETTSDQCRGTAERIRRFESILKIAAQAYVDEMEGAGHSERRSLEKAREIITAYVNPVY